MQSIALMPTATLARLRTLLPHEFLPRGVTIEESKHLLATATGGSFILDPTDLRQDIFASVIHVMSISRMSVVVFAPLSTAIRIRQMLCSTMLELVLFGVENERELLRRAVEDGRDPTVPALVLHGIAPNLQLLSPRIAQEILKLFGWAAIPASVSKFAENLNQDPSTVNRALRRANLGLTSDILTGASLARAYEPLRGGNQSISFVIDRLERHGLRALQAQFRRFVQLPPRRAMRELPPEEFAARLLARIAIQSL